MVQIKTDVLRRACNPWVAWGGRETPELVREAIDVGRLEAKPAAIWRDRLGHDHVARIAYLVLNPDPTPIEIDVGVPSLGIKVWHIVTDGNHRFCAALFRGDSTICANISGSIEYAARLFDLKFLGARPDKSPAGGSVTADRPGRK